MTCFMPCLNAMSSRTKVIRIDEFPIADASINQLMPVLLNALKAEPLLSNRLFEVHFLATLKVKCWFH